MVTIRRENKKKNMILQCPALPAPYCISFDENMHMKYIRAASTNMTDVWHVWFWKTRDMWSAASHNCRRIAGEDQV